MRPLHAALAVPLASLLLCAASLGPASAQAPRPDAARAEDSDTIIRGPTRPRLLAALGPQTDGVVRAVAVVEGATVKRGDVLIRLVDDVQEARIGLARAAAESEGDLRQAQAQREEAAAVLARTQAAAGRGAATEWEVRQARSRLDVARAAADGAAERRRIEQRRLELEQATLEQMLIRAPFDGVVAKLDIVPGATIVRSDRPVTVADLSVLETVMYVPAAAWPHLKLGGGYRLALSAPVSRTVPARLRHLDPVMDAASGRFRAIFLIDNPDRSLPAGLEATLDLGSLAP